ncbi:hypothetical protein Y032_0609g610 [Ancylostoma ceylanicum]|uniref:Uncharacterized protein n=1 Tax=Ancylostoma ceylanicum TaxID=53326 RepID=A0A016WLJ1_9BILA|nr:hypothetical protein Y032_0609g610 [Ancylostoma ceylanicum]
MDIFAADLYFNCYTSFHHHTPCLIITSHLYAGQTELREFQNREQFVQENFISRSAKKQYDQPLDATSFWILFNSEIFNTLTKVSIKILKEIYRTSEMERYTKKVICYPFTIDDVLRNKSVAEPSK